MRFRFPLHWVPGRHMGTLLSSASVLTRRTARLALPPPRLAAELLQPEASRESHQDEDWDGCSLYSESGA